MSIGSFILVKNEIAWIKSHIENVAPHLDEMVFFDGNSTDGTLEYLLKSSKKYPHIKVHKNRDPRNLKDDYTFLFDQCLRTLTTDWAIFLHPDMWVENPKKLKVIGELFGTAMSCDMVSYCGEPKKQLYRIDQGRGDSWKNIYRLRNPDLGAHYFGWYGAANEDVYFSKISGDAHHFHGTDFQKYPYDVIESGLVIHHFSDVRPYERRLSRMVSCLMNQGADKKTALKIAKEHPRVTLDSNHYFKISPCMDPRRTTANV